MRTLESEQLIIHNTPYRKVHAHHKQTNENNVRAEGEQLRETTLNVQNCMIRNLLADKMHQCHGDHKFILNGI